MEMSIVLQGFLMFAAFVLILLTVFNRGLGGNNA